jgi:hypothetical protein
MRRRRGAGRHDRERGDPRKFTAWGLALWLHTEKGVTLNNAATVTAPSDFSNVTWEKLNATVTTNTTTDPLGGSTADTITDTAANAQHIVYQLVPGASAVHGWTTVSFYLKAGTRSWAFVGGNSGALGRFFDLTNGVMGNTEGTLIASSIESAGNGWYLCSITYASTDAYALVYVASANGTRSYSGGAGSIHVYGAAMSQPIVSAWADQSGVANHFTQATASNQMQYEGVGLLGRPSIKGDATNDYLSCTTALAQTLFGGIDNSFTVMLSGEQTAAGNQFVIGAGRTSTTARLNINFTTGGNEAFKRDNAGATAGPSGGTTAVGRHVLQAICAGTTYTAIRDGTTVINAGAFDVGDTTFDTAVIACSFEAGSPSAFANFRYKELLAFTADVPESPRQRMHRRLAAEVGIAA